MRQVMGSQFEVKRPRGDPRLAVNNNAISPICKEAISGCARSVETETLQVKTWRKTFPDM